MTDTYDEDLVGPVKELVHRVLDAVVAVYAQNSVSLPDRRYVQLNTATVDCEQVTVSLAQMYLGSPGNQAILPQRCESPRTAVMLVEIVRCVPAPGPRGVPPTVAQIEASADQFLIDAWLLMEAVTVAVDTGFDGVLADVSASDRQGQFQGITLTLIMQV